MVLMSMIFTKYAERLYSNYKAPFRGFFHSIDTKTPTRLNPALLGLFRER